MLAEEDVLAPGQESNRLENLKQLPDMTQSQWEDEYDIVVAIENLEDLVHDGWEIRCSTKLQNDGSPPKEYRPRGAAAIAQDIHSCTLPHVRWHDVDIDESGEEEEKKEQNEEKKINPPKSEQTPPPPFASIDDDTINRYSTIFVAVLGLYNKGKTYVLNHLADSILPHGSAYHTQGICMKTPRNPAKSKMTFIDTAGFDFPVKVASGSDDNTVHKKKMVDQFIEDVALRLATVSIVVMNDITLYDQIYLETVRDTLQRYRKEGITTTETTMGSEAAAVSHGKYAELIVVHNFALCEDFDDCKKAFEEQVAEKYNGDWRDQGLPGTGTRYRYWYTKEEQGRQVGMRHVFIGRFTQPLKPTPRFTIFGKTSKINAMQEHNARTFLIIESWIQTHANEVKFEPLGKIVSCTNEILPKYLINPPSVKLTVKKNKNMSKSLAIQVAKKDLWNPDIYPTTTREQGKENTLLTALIWRSTLEQHPTMPTMQMNAPSYDVISTRTTVIIVLDRVVPIPKIDFDPITKVCTVKGTYVEPKIYSREGVSVEHRGRRLGEYDLSIDLTRHLSHNVALQMTGYSEDVDENLLFVTFEKIRPSRFFEPSKANLDSLFAGKED